MACNVYTSLRRSPVSKAHIRQVIHVTLTRFRVPDADISIHAVGEAKMRTLNRVFRGIDRPTDVLSFPTDGGVPRSTEVDMGDVFFCPTYIKKQAVRFGVLFQEEVDRMLIHGVLHLQGYDHVKKKQAKEMFSLQESILESLS